MELRGWGKVLRWSSDTASLTPPLGWWVDGDNVHSASRGRRWRGEEVVGSVTKRGLALQFGSAALGWPPAVPGLGGSSRRAAPLKRPSQGPHFCVSLSPAACQGPRMRQLPEPACQGGLGEEGVLKCSLDAPPVKWWAAGAFARRRGGASMGCVSFHVEWRWQLGARCRVLVCSADLPEQCIRRPNRPWIGQMSRGCRLLAAGLPARIS